MPLTSEQQGLCKRLFNNLNPDKALDPDHPFYEPLYADSETDDPVGHLANSIRYGGEESLQLFSGFRGSGKTTELNRLKRDLEAQGYFVLYANALDYLNPAEPLEISDILLVLAGSFSYQLESKGIDIASDSYWQRFTHFLGTTNVQLADFGMKAGVTGLEASMKLAFRTTPTFRQRLQEAMQPRLGELRDNVRKFVEDGVEQIRRKTTDQQVVFLFDQLEQFRGSLTNEAEMLRSVERVFSAHLSLLRLPYVHCVFTVPPWLKLIPQGPGAPVTVLNCVKLWGKDPARTPFQAGERCLRRLLQRRFGDGEYLEFFGEPPDPARSGRADRLLSLCGGHFRDLLRLARECVLRANSLPISDAVITAAIRNVKSSFLPIAVEDAKWLHRIGQERDTILQTTGATEVNRLARLLDTHFVLYLRNGDEWYDIHPMIRDEVAEIVAKAESLPKPGA